MTMREKLIEALKVHGKVTGCCGGCYVTPDDEEAAAILDAIFTTLAEPDAGMATAAADECVAILREADPNEASITPDGRKYANGHAGRIIAAAINHVRSGN